MKNSSKYLLIAGGVLLGTAGGMTIGITAADELHTVARAPQDFIQKVNAKGSEKPVIPINDIVSRYKADGSRITDIEMDRELFRDVYELEIVDAGGQTWDIDIDARSGEELSKYKDWDD